MSIKDGVVNLSSPPKSGPPSAGAGVGAGSGSDGEGTLPFDDKWGLTGGKVQPPSSIPPPAAGAAAQSPHLTAHRDTPGRPTTAKRQTRESHCVSQN